MDNRNNSNFVKASLAEFISVWSLGGEASLNLNTKDGKLNMSFNISLGNPGISIYPSPPTSSAKPRHRGPAEKERGRQRAICHQASKITAPKPTPVALVPDPVWAVDPVLAPAPAPPSVTAHITAGMTLPVTSTVNAPVTAKNTAPVKEFDIPSFASIASRDTPQSSVTPLRTSLVMNSDTPVTAALAMHHYPPLVKSVARQQSGAAPE